MKGINFIGFSESKQSGNTFKAFNPATNQALPGDFSLADREELNRALSLGDAAFDAFRIQPAVNRANFLRAIAEEIMGADELVSRCTMETALPESRIISERGRTCGQLNLFADLLIDGWWADARIDTADALRKPLPKPDIRRMMTALGPVAVFGASNFPLAFSTAGGDTASALAAGCPVIVKAHPSHPGTNEIISSCIIRAAKKTNMPEGVFSSLYLSNEMAIQLVKHPVIKAVGFTGSRKGGMALFNAAMQRDEPIPVYAEMSAVNPVIILDDALRNNSSKIAAGFVQSVILGSGQFCTNPGIIALKEGEWADNFLAQVAENISRTIPSTMLNRHISESYAENIAVMEKEKHVQVLSRAATKPVEGKNEALPVTFTVKVKDFIDNRILSEEIFGPASVLVSYSETHELLKILESMEGQLTATIHAGEKDKETVEQIVNVLTKKAGRIIFGGFPTGVEVCHAMQHGGPFPATTDSRSTSVGTAAIYRFLRPVAYQDFPDQLLPEALQNANPLGILRLVNGQWTRETIGF